MAKTTGVVVKTVGAPVDAPRLDHAAFAESLGFVDAEHGAQASGSRFAYLMREAVLLELALVQWVMGKLVGNGFTPVVPPVLVRESTMLEAGFFPTDRAQVYEVDGGELFLVGTSEVPLAMLHRGDTFGNGDLPQRYAGLSTCFRREAGTHGKDTKGIFRVHQFDKVEMFSYCDPDSSWDEHERILAIEEGIVGDLGLPYRVVNIAAGDLGAAAAKKYDIEVWLPSEGRYRELTSCSNYLEYSARRQGLRVRGDDGSRSGAHAQRHRVRGEPHARVPVRALPGSRRCLRRSRRAPPDLRLRPRRAEVGRRPAATLRRPVRMVDGGVPERPNGTVLKTVEVQASEGSNPSPSARVVVSTTSRLV